MHDSNPLCGDEIDIHLKIESNKVEEVEFEGRGCAISQASASMLTEMVTGKDLEFVKDLKKEDILENIGLLNLGPARIKCALLSLKVLKVGMVQYYVDKGLLRPLKKSRETHKYIKLNRLFVHI